MSVMKIALSGTDLCLGIYNQLKAEGLVTDTIGTPSEVLAVFSSPLVPSGYYLCFRTTAESSLNFPISVEMGTVSGTTFTAKASIAVYSAIYENNRSNLILYYDAAAPWMLMYDTGGQNRFTYIGKLSTGKKISFCLASKTHYITPPLDLDIGSSLGGLWTFHRNASYNGYYLEQPLALIDAGGTIIMDGTSPASVIGIKTISAILDIATPVSEIGGSALFGLQYIESTAMKSQLSTYLKMDMS